MAEQRKLENAVQAVDESASCSGACTELEATRKSTAALSTLGLELTEEGNIKSVFINYCLILQKDPYLSNLFFVSALDGRPYVRGAFWDISLHSVKDVDFFNVRRYMSNIFGIASEKEVKEAMMIRANENQFHPIQNKLNALRWDGQSRIGELLPRYLGAERSDYTTAVTLMLLHGAIRRVFDPGVKFDCCVILADTQQGTGKSTICRFLALDDAWFTDCLGNLSRTKEAYEAIRGKWVIEMAELISTRNTSDIETVKAFITRTADDYREPYGIFAERRPRQCIFIGTTNRPNFLPGDKTGNRRFIPVLCDGDRATVHPMHDEQETRSFILQCYAEAMAIGIRDGWQLTLDHRFDDQLEALREKSTPEDSRVGMIQRWLDATDEPRVCTRMIYRMVFDSDRFEHTEPKKYELDDIAEIMRLNITGWQPYPLSKNSKTKFKDYGVQRTWVRIDGFKGEAATDTQP